MTTRQEERDQGDMSHGDQKKRRQKFLAAKSKQQQEIEPGVTRALVIGVGLGVCTVFSEEALSSEKPRIIRCEISVAPGDEVSILREKVTAISPRRTTIARTHPSNRHRDRVIAANIDILVIVASIDNPQFRPGLVDRYLIAAARGGVRPILCVNKVDLQTDTSAADIFNVPVVRCSTLTGDGVDGLRDMLAGSLTVLAGQSGVGKSSLLNALAGEDHARTGAISEDTGKGRHTTTASRLYQLKNGARIIDTPGIREFGLGPITREDLQAAFPEFEGKQCRFDDCTHRDELDCAVREQGGPRYASYLRLALEL
jgi:ribosome biogenesis GTPase